MATPGSTRSRVTLDIIGIVQGVGFRPTIAVAATRRGISGFIRNQAGRVRLVIEGEGVEVDRFISDLPSELPPQARVDEVRILSREPLAREWTGAPFRILESTTPDAPRSSIPADLAICSDCRRDVLDARSRFYGYPFTTCTNCGPRYTVVTGTPYDRARTSLAPFPLCEECLADYSDPGNRRFHAQSIACPRCGPWLSLLDEAGREIPGRPLIHARRALAEGRILAIRGLGGFLLAVDASDAPAVERLRRRKLRPDKPFAVMARNMEVIERLCLVDDEARRILEGPKAPIVVLDQRQETGLAASLDRLSPGTRTLGVMMPATPLQLLLAEPLAEDDTPPFDLLVMTSGNRGGEPICVDNGEALERLRGIADLLLVHNREIRLRADDSLVGIVAGKPRTWRRARGWAPETIRLAAPLDRAVLALGADLKNTVALGSEREVAVSPHVGDLETADAIDALGDAIEALQSCHRCRPEAIAVDLHPDMHSSRLGRRYAAERGLPLVEVQHHHAHALAVMAEHGADEAMALVFDGTGLGSDGNIWGAELLSVGPEGFQRLASFKDVPLPGGDEAVRRPARQLVARWLDSGIVITPAWREHLGLDDAQLEALSTQCLRGLNAPRTHAAGRVFDSFSVLAGVAPRRATYEAHAAVLLEAAAMRSGGGAGIEVPFGIVERDGLLMVDWGPAFAEFADRPPDARLACLMARGFHRAMCDAALAMARGGLERCGLRRIALAGGVMMNRRFADQLTGGLKISGFEVLLPREIPPNDGGISLGQVVAAGGRSC